MKKTINYRFAFTLVIFMFIFWGATAQNGTVKGMVTEKFSEEPVKNANITLLKNGIQVYKTKTDIYGRYTINFKQDGVYELKAEMEGYNSASLKNIIIKKDFITFQDIKLEEKAIKKEPAFKPLLPSISMLTAPLS